MELFGVGMEDSSNVVDSDLNRVMAMGSRAALSENLSLDSPLSMFGRPSPDSAKSSRSR